MSIYAFTARTAAGSERSLQEYAGKVLLIVNTASRCGFTPQYAGLQELYEKYHSRGFEILAFPCNQFAQQEPGSDAEIQSFCTTNFGVTFPVFAKIEVNGPNAHPLYQYLVQHAPGFLGSRSIKWNFTKFLVDRTGRVVRRYAPRTSPDALAPVIEKLLEQPVPPTV